MRKEVRQFGLRIAFQEKNSYPEEDAPQVGGEFQRNPTKEIEDGRYNEEDEDHGSEDSHCKNHHRKAPQARGEKSAGCPAARKAMPSREEIERLAQTYWAQRGYQDGYAEQDWLRAEQELLKMAS